MSRVRCFCTRTLPPDVFYLNQLQQQPPMTVDSLMSPFKFEEPPLNLDHLVDEIEEEEEDDLSESILDDEIIEEEFVNVISEPILDVDVSETMETRTEWTIRLINEGHQGPNQTSGRRARRTPRMRVITDYTLYRIQMPQSTLDDTYSDEIEEEEEIQEEEEEENDIKDQDMSEYLETRTYYAPSPAMDIDVNEGDPVVVDEEQEACAICLAEYQDEDTIASLQCGHEFHVGCINKWLQRKNRTCPFCRAPVLPPSHD